MFNPVRNKYIFIETDKHGSPCVFATYPRLKELKERYKRRASLHGNGHVYHAFHASRTLILKF